MSLESGAGKGAQFLATRIGQDALSIAELVETVAAKDARIAVLEKILTPAQRKRIDPPKPKE